MQYRKFGHLDWQVSALGFGAMRLPCLDNRILSGNIDEKEAGRMIRYAIDEGVNYLDTAYPYHMGNSEVFLGKVLRDGCRDRVRVATKSPVWFVKESKDFDKYLHEQLNRLQTDHIDYYLFHGLNKATWENTVQRLNLIEQAENAIRAGKIGHLGFSFHDEYDVFQDIVDGYDKWTFCQIQYNYMDIHNQAGLKGLAYAAAKGLAVVVMEPLLGGRLANPPGPVGDLFIGAGSGRSPADWALQWLWNQPEVSLVLSGMSTFQQVQENLKSADQSGVDVLSEEEMEFIRGVRSKFQERIAIPCTKCGYCMPCPNGVNIPKNFEIYNDGWIYENLELAKRAYQHFFGEDEKADKCLDCTVCEELCLQMIPIGEWLARVHETLGK